MNENLPNLPQSLRTALDTFYQVRQPDIHFTNRLGDQLHQRQIEMMASVPAAALSQQKLDLRRPMDRGFSMHTLRATPMMAVMVVILALLFLTGIAYAIGRLSGFIPGIGFVGNVQYVIKETVVVAREALSTPTAVLAKNTNTPQGFDTPTAGQVNAPNPYLSPTLLPVQQKNGIIITIEKVVAEANRLVIAYRISGLPADMFGPERIPTLQVYAEAHPDEPRPENVRLPDGTLLEQVNGGNCAGGGDGRSSWLSCQSLYAPLPDGVNRFTLQIHKLPNALPDELPEDWDIPIQLIHVDASSIGNGFEEPNLRSQPMSGITLSLLNVDRSMTQTAFQFGLDWEGENRMPEHIDPISLQDDQGRVYPLSSGGAGDQWSPEHPNRLILAAEVTTLINGKRPMTFRLNQVVMEGTDQASFLFDPGTDAKPGQEWNLDQTIRVSGFDLHFTHALLKMDEEGLPSIAFDVQAPSEVLGIPLFTDGLRSSGSDFDTARDVWVCYISLRAIPTQPLELNVSQVTYQVNGPWEVTWQP